MDEQRLSSILIRHELAARDLDEGEADKIVRTLNETIEYQREKLLGRYAVAQAKGVDPGPATTKYVEDSIQAITAVNEEVYAKIGKRVEGQLIDRARHEMKFTKDAVKASGGVINAATIPDTNYLRTLVRNSPIAVDENTATLLQPWLKDMEANNLNRLGSIIRSSMIAGDTPAVFAKRIEEAGFAKSRRSAQSLVITANASVANQARLETFKKMRGITHVEWSSVLDSRTTPGCQNLSGKIFPIDSPHPTPPRHIRCRSILLPRKNDTDPPLHKPYSEWLKGQSSDVQNDVLGKGRGEAFRSGTIKAEDVYRRDGSFKTLDELAKADAKITGTAPTPTPAPAPVAKPRFTTPVNPDVTAETIVVKPRKEAINRLNLRTVQAAADPRYDPVPEYKGIKATDLGKAALPSFNDQAASMIEAIMPEVDAISDAFNIPRLRSIRQGAGSYIATMGDGTLTMNASYFNSYAASIGSTNPVASTLAKIVADRDAVALELKAMREGLDAIKLRIADLPLGEAKTAVIHEYLDKADAFNAKRKTWMAIDKKVLVAKRGEGAANRPASEWKPGDDIKTRPYNATDYFSGIDKARNVIFHEMGHHVHQSIGKTGRRSKVGKPPVERRLAQMFFDKFHGRGPNGASAIELKKLLSSTYATTNEHEWFAESFGLYMMGRKDLVDPDLVKLIEELLDGVGQ